MLLNEDTTKLYSEMIEAKKLAEKYEKKYKELSEQMKELLGDEELTDLEGNLIVKYVLMERINFNADAFKKDYPELYEKYKNKKSSFKQAKFGKVVL